jgi:hypothetical protein
MSDDLVKRLRDPSLGSPRWMDTMTEAADRIAELEAALRDARHDLVAFIENAHPHREKYPHIMQDFENDMEIVRRIDAALEGKKDE